MSEETPVPSIEEVDLPPVIGITEEGRLVPLVAPPDPTVRDVATVTVSEAVDGTKQRKPRNPKRGKSHRPHRGRSTAIEHVVVDPRVLEAAQALVRPGVTRLEIVDAECVKVVNICEATKRIAHKTTAHRVGKGRPTSAA
jgi:hypothetical protein